MTGETKAFASQCKLPNGNDGRRNYDAHSHSTIEWKTANVIPLPKRNPPVSIEKDIRPISLTPIAAKVFESIVMEWIDEKMDGKIDNKQLMDPQPGAALLL